jgi:hypothetical protein
MSSGIWRCVDQYAQIFTRELAASNLYLSRRTKDRDGSYSLAVSYNNHEREDTIAAQVTFVQILSRCVSPERLYLLIWLWNKDLKVQSGRVHIYNCFPYSFLFICIPLDIMDTESWWCISWIWCWGNSNIKCRLIYFRPYAFSAKKQEHLMLNRVCSSVCLCDIISVPKSLVKLYLEIARFILLLNVEGQFQFLPRWTTI